MSLNVDTLNLSISVSAPNIQVANTSTPLLLTAHVPTTGSTTDRIRFYSSAAAMTPEFATTEQCYLDAAGIFSQNPCPATIAVGFRGTAAIQSTVFTPTSTTVQTYRLSVTDTATGVTTSMPFTGSATTATTLTNMLASYTSLAAQLAALNPVQALQWVLTTSATSATITSSTAGYPFVATVYTAAGAIDPLWVNTITFTPSSTSAQAYKLVVTDTATGITTSMPFTGSATTATTLTNMSTAYTNLVASLAALSPPQTLTWSLSTSSTVATLSGTVSGHILNAQVFTAAGAVDPLWVPAGVQNHGCADDLNEINAINPAWYLVLYADARDDGHQHVIAQWCESQKRQFFAQSQASHFAQTLNNPYNVANQVITVTAGSVNMNANAHAEFCSSMNTLNYNNTAVFAHNIDAEPLAASAASIMLAQIAGSMTLKFKNLSGITADTITDTQVLNLVGKGANGYRTESGRAMLFPGQTPSEEWIDNVFGQWTLIADMTARIAFLFFTQPKVPFTQQGIQMVVSCVQAALDNASSTTTQNKLIARSRVLADGITNQSPAYTITAPLIQNIPAYNRAQRIVPSSNPIIWEATLSGAINSVTITGTVSV